MWPLLALMAGGGALLGNEKHNNAVANENADRKLAASTQQYSPWTHLQAQPIRRANSAAADVGGGALSGAMTGASLGSAMAAMPSAPVADSGLAAPSGGMLSGGDPMSAQAAALNPGMPNLGGPMSASLSPAGGMSGSYGLGGSVPSLMGGTKAPVVGGQTPWQGQIPQALQPPQMGAQQNPWTQLNQYAGR